LPEWIDIKEVKDVLFQATLDVDLGEASAIALAIELGTALIVLDDDKARKKARKLQLNITGTLGLFLKAKREGIIPDVRSILNKVQATNFRYSESVFNEILKLAGE